MGERGAPSRKIKTEELSYRIKAGGADFEIFIHVVSPCICRFH